MKKFLSVLFLLSFSFLLGGGETDPGFVWQLNRSGEGEYFLNLTVSPGFYIDSSTITVEVKDLAGKELVPVLKTPPAEKKSDDGSVQKIFNGGVWRWSIPGVPADGKVSYQGCNDDGMCFMPQEFLFSGGNAVMTGTTEANGDAGQYKLVRKAEGYMDTADFINFLKGGKTEDFFGDAGIIGILLLTLLGGLGLNLTPCILPMVPVTLIIIGAKGGGKPGFRRGCAYGLGMALAYGLLGLAAALLGIGFGSINSMPIFNFIIAGVFLVLALCMAGVFNFNFGARFRVSPQKLKGPALLVAFVMGALSALLAGACVAPVVISVLIFVAREYNSGNHWALFLPFLLGIGMALPWPFAGMGLSVLPKPGKFMLAVKYALAAVVAVMGIYYSVIGFELLKNRSAEPDTPAADGFAALIHGAGEYRKNGKPLLVKFGASWCKNCHAMDKTTFKDPEVIRILNENFNLVSFPAENPNEPRIKALLDSWNIPGFPAFVIAVPEK